MTKHSPGPWHVVVGGNFVVVGSEGYGEYVERTSYGGGPKLVATINYAQSKGHSSTPALAESNGRLIAAAPDLLEALKAYMFTEQTRGGLNPHKAGTNKHRAFELGREAIGKAEER